MPFDFRKIAPPKAAARPTDPIALFQSLRVTDPAINDLWLAQGDALREWDGQRAAPDVAIVLNTGAGKTLVGLLAAQSLVNETNGQVVYACSSIQLVQQTASKARGYGLGATTYVGGNFSNTFYQQGLAPCITTYHALFNGRSRFFNDDINAIVFDDAHTAGHILRDQFTLRIARDAFPETFVQVVQLFRPYFTRIGQEMGYVETQDHVEAVESWFVPPFALRQQFGELQRTLREASLSTRLDTMFAWEYVRDHLDLCALFISGTDVSLTPPVVPVQALSYFRNGGRRLYLSATMSAKDSFLRTFGRVPDPVIAPSTTAGECERLILIPAISPGKGTAVQDITLAKRIVESHKCLVLVPTRRRARVWDEIATKFNEDVADQVEDFKHALPPACLVLTARYDGVDLPGDTCRVLVIDDLPTGLNPLERYLWERLGLGKLLRSTIPSRVVQSFGRISRGMSDHGAVVLTGKWLVEWVLSPKHQALLPEFLQRQIQLGIHLSRQISTAEDLVDAVAQCLSRDEEWITLYQRSMAESQVGTVTAVDTGDVLRITQVETDFGQALWERDYATAAKAIERDLAATFTASRPAGAWHALWLGYCYELMADTHRARALYDRAHRAVKAIPPFAAQANTQEQAGYSSQIIAVASSLQEGDQVRLVLPRDFDAALAALDGSATVPQIEAALEALGEYLGLEARRPDNEFGTGPDVLWTMSGGPALSVEAKTAKGTNAVYTKRDLGQLRDHRQWVHGQLGETTVYSVFIGPIAPASQDANPDPDMVVIELTEFHTLRERLRAALLDICATGTPAMTETSVRDVFTERGLLWPNVYEQLSKHALR